MSPVALWFALGLALGLILGWLLCNAGFAA